MHDTKAIILEEISSFDYADVCFVLTITNLTNLESCGVHFQCVSSPCQSQAFA